MPIRAMQLRLKHVGPIASDFHHDAGIGVCRHRLDRRQSLARVDGGVPNLVDPIDLGNVNDASHSVVTSPRRALPRLAAPRPALPRRAEPRRAVPRRAVPSSNKFVPSMFIDSHLALPRRASPGRAVPSLAQPRRAEPRPATPRRVIKKCRVLRRRPARLLSCAGQGRVSP